MFAVCGLPLAAAHAARRCSSSCIAGACPGLNSHSSYMRVALAGGRALGAAVVGTIALSLGLVSRITRSSTSAAIKLMNARDRLAVTLQALSTICCLSGWRSW